MSKSLRLLSLIFWVIFALSYGSPGAFAQDLTATVSINQNSPSTAVVEGKFPASSVHRELRFLTDYAHIKDLDKRISDLKLFDRLGDPVNGHMVAPGRFVAEKDFTAWAYRIDLTPNKDRFTVAHLSWATNKGALILPGDLLPQGHRSARITVTVQNGWMVRPEGEPGPNVLEFADVEKAVIFAGPAMRTRTIRSSGAEIEVILTGEWLFNDDDAFQMAESIFATYAELFGDTPAKKVSIAVGPFPYSVPHGQWEGSSRGTNVSIVSSDMPFKSQSLQRLHEQLRHEVFHLWIPNAVNLTGNYDWFYEGFALYQSLKTGVAVNRISFADMLDTIGRAYDISASQRTMTSLTEASKDRWRGSNTQVYARGMLAAFASDLAMLRASKGKRSIGDVIRKVFLQHRGTNRQEANVAIIKILNSYSELRPIIDGAIRGSGSADLTDLLFSAGLVMDLRDQLVRIRVIESPSGRQREVLDRLGYNSWRKVPTVKR